MTANDTLRILGVDPALRCTGYGMVEAARQRFHAIDCGVIRSPAKIPLSACLRRLSGGIHELLETYKPAVVAIEGGFYSKNARTALVLGAARGVVIAAAAAHDIPVYEYAPRRIKQAVCGYGNADKEQVATIMAQLLKVDSTDMLRDATDALGAAICHAFAHFTNQGIFLPKPI